MMHVLRAYHSATICGRFLSKSFNDLLRADSTVAACSNDSSMSIGRRRGERCGERGRYGRVCYERVCYDRVCYERAL